MDNDLDPPYMYEPNILTWKIELVYKLCFYIGIIWSKLVSSAL